MYPTRGRINYLKGLIYEFLSVIVLLCKGYRIAKIRARAMRGDIDILAIKDRTLVLFEIKYRKDPGLALEAIDIPRMEKKFLFLSREISRFRNIDQYRFDAIVWYKLIMFKHIENITI